MADQRLMLRYGDRSIMLAKRSGTGWISSHESANDLGDFLNEVSDLYTATKTDFNEISRPTVEVFYEHDDPESLWYCDPIITVSNGS